MTVKNPRIVVEEKKDGGLRVRIDSAHSQDHAIYMLSQAIGTIIIENSKKAMEGEEHVVQELPTADEKEAKDLPDVQ